MSVTDWSVAPAANATSDPTIPALDGTSARKVPELVRGVMAKMAALSADQGGALTTGGTDNAYTVTTLSGISKLRAGVRLVIRPDRTNTGAPTLNVDGAGPKAWLDFSGAVPAAGQIRPDRFVTVTFDEGRNAWLSGTVKTEAEIAETGPVSDAIGSVREFAETRASSDVNDLLGTTRPLRDQALMQPAIFFVVTGTKDGYPTVDEQPAIQAAWDKATAIGLPLVLTPGPGVSGIIDVRIKRCLRASKNGARLHTDGRVRLHGYATDFTSVIYDLTDANIPVGNMVYFGPPAGSPVRTYISDVGAERITCVFHPPADAQGNRIPSLNTVHGVYFDRCIRPRARRIDVSGLNSGFGFAFTSCQYKDFDGITVHDCDMVVDPTSTDDVNRNKQITGVNADDLWAGRGIPPSIGGFVRNIEVYGLTSNRAFKQIDGVTDQGTRGTIWSGIVVRGCDEGLDTYATGSTYDSCDFSECTCDVKVGHGAYNNTIRGQGKNGSSPVGGGRAAILLFAGNRGDTARNRITWELTSFTGTRLIGIEADNDKAFSATGAPIVTKAVCNVFKLVARSCQSLRLSSEAGTGLGNVIDVDIDPASVASSPAGSEAEYLQGSSNPATRVTIKRGQNTRPTAPNVAAARLQGANYATGFYDQQNGNLVPLASGDELDRVHGLTGVGLMRRRGPGDYEFTAAPTLTKIVATPAPQPGGAVRALEASNPTAPAAGNAIVLDFAPNNAGPGLRSGQLVFSDPTGGNQIQYEVKLSNGDAPATVFALTPGGDVLVNGIAVITGGRAIRPRAYTTGTLPTAGQSSGDLAYATDARALAAGGQLEPAPGRGALVEYVNAAWRIAGTNIVATAA